MLIFFCSLLQTILLYLPSLQIPGRKKSLEPCIQDQFEFSKRVLIGFRMENNGLLESNQVSDPSERPTPILQNTVSTVNLDCTLDLRAIALHARNAEYNPKRFAAVIMRIKEPKTTALIFSSGKIVCTGAKTQQHSHLAARKYAKIVQKLGFDVKFKDFKIQNMVASCNVYFSAKSCTPWAFSLWVFNIWARVVSGADLSDEATQNYNADFSVWKASYYWSKDGTWNS